MVLSARNGIKGKVTDVKLGEVMSSVKIEVTEPGVITAVITRDYFLTIFYFFNYNFLNFLDYFYYF